MTEFYFYKVYIHVGKTTKCNYVSDVIEPCTTLVLKLSCAWKSPGRFKKQWYFHLICKYFDFMGLGEAQASEIPHWLSWAARFGDHQGEEDKTVRWEMEGLLEGWCLMILKEGWEIAGGERGQGMVREKGHCKQKREEVRRTGAALDWEGSKSL